MNVGEVCSREAFIFKTREPPVNAVAGMTKRHIGTVVVVEPEAERVRPIGIVAEALAALARPVGRQARREGACAPR
jgi:hypothetical protein